MLPEWFPRASYVLALEARRGSRTQTHVAQLWRVSSRP